MAISEICRREGIAASVYYKWSKAFLEAGKNGLTRTVIRDATADEVKQMPLSKVILSARTLHTYSISKSDFSNLNVDGKPEIFCKITNLAEILAHFLPTLSVGGFGLTGLVGLVIF